LHHFDLCFQQAKAHSTQDLRIPVFETNENPHHRHMDMPGSERDPNARGTDGHSASIHGIHAATPHQSTYQPKDLTQFACLPSEQRHDRAYYMYVYKTRACANFPFCCECDGLDYHRDEERRRGPIITYAAQACTNVKPYLNSEWGNPNVDCSGRYKPKVMRNGQLVPQESEHWDCGYAHSLLELMYHPQVYKTGICSHFNVKFGRVKSHEFVLFLICAIVIKSIESLDYFIAKSKNISSQLV
jgi:hypothetical protein